MSYAYDTRLVIRTVSDSEGVAVGVASPLGCQCSLSISRLGRILFAGKLPLAIGHATQQTRLLDQDSQRPRTGASHLAHNLPPHEAW